MNAQVSDATRTFKLTLSSIAVLAGGGFLFSHASGQFYPAVPISLLLVVIIFLTSLGVNQGSGLDDAYIGVLLILAITYSIYIFSVPSSLVGIDPNSLAIDIQQLRMTGDLAVIESEFYSNAPAYFLLPAVLGAIGDLPAHHAMVLYPLVLNIVVPLSAGIVAIEADNRHRPFVGTLAALLTFVATISFKFSYWPVPQSLAVVLTSVFVVLLVQNYNSVRPRTVFLETVILVGLMFSHKLPLMFLFVFLLALLAVTTVHHFTPELSWLTNHSLRVPFYGLIGLGLVGTWLFLTQYFTPTIFRAIGVTVFFVAMTALYMNDRQTDLIRHVPSPSPSLIHLSGITVLTGGLFAIQMTVLTNFGEQLLTILRSYNNIELIVTSSLQQTAPAATSPTFPLFGMFFHHSNALLLLLVAGASWVYLASVYETNSAVRILLTVTCFSVLLIGATAINPSAASPFRFLLMGEPWLVAITAVTFGGLILDADLSGVSQIVGLLLVILVVFQLFSFAVVPDYPSSPRFYLTESETEAKGFGYHYIDEDIGADAYLVTASAPMEITNSAFRETGKYVSEGNKIISGNISERNTDYFVFRKLQIYRTTSGWWQLTWDPQETLDRTEHEIYDNGDVQVYKNP